jgi:hypothetical protein
MSGDLLATSFHVDEAEDTFTVNRVQDVEPHLDYAKRLQSETQKSDWGRHVAHIPNIFLEQWLKEEWERGNVNLRMFTPEFDKMIDRKIKDPDWAFLRTDKKESSIAGWSAGLVA